ncbi:AAA family ATPase [Lysinibacillus sp. 54212]|uniref:AAA family ATPase n=1 Tax=Lysinibacillus sp. 54212 TaxID=3119829 RepID=UPI002FCAB441
MSHLRLHQIQQSLNAKFYDREEEIEALLTALLSRQHILFIGPAGTGKSALSAMLGEIVEGSRFFQHLLTSFSTPEELFGVLSLKDLEQGVYKRNIEGMLPQAHFAFIDEIFKANSAILNALLTLINERVFTNNGVAIPSPLMTIVGSSNEYIEGDEGLEALFDRFLLRYEVDYIREDNLFIAMLKNEQQTEVPRLSLEELYEHQELVDTVKIPNDVYTSLSNIRKKLRDEGIRPSDRRFKQSLSLLRAKAYLDGRFQVNRSDLVLLSNVLWERAEQRDATTEIVTGVAHDTVDTFIQQIRPAFESIVLNVQNELIQKTPSSRAKLSELLLQGKSLYLEVQEKHRQAPNREELLLLKNDMHKRLMKITSDVIGF